MQQRSMPDCGFLLPGMLHHFRVADNPRQYVIEKISIYFASITQELDNIRRVVRG
jgi:hypothetical protein